MQIELTVEELRTLMNDNPMSSEAIKTGAVKELIRAVSEGKRVTAIKAYRDLTGAELKEAKDAVEGSVSCFDYWSTNP